MKGFTQHDWNHMHDCILHATWDTTKKIDENYEICQKIKLHTYESDDEFDERMVELEKMPDFDSNKKEIIMELIKRGYIFLIYKIMKFIKIIFKDNRKIIKELFFDEKRNALRFTSINGDHMLKRPVYDKTLT